VEFSSGWSAQGATQGGLVSARRTALFLSWGMGRAVADTDTDTDTDTDRDRDTYSQLYLEARACICELELLLRFLLALGPYIFASLRARQTMA